MKLHEYQSKQLLASYGIPIPRGATATSPNEAFEAAEAHGGSAVVKAQVLSGGRGKAGGIVPADTSSEVKCAATRLLGTTLVTGQSGSLGLPINTVLVEQAVTPQRELYLAVLLNPSRRRVVFVASARGGMDIEELAETNPDEIISLAVDPLTGPLPYQVRLLARALGLDGQLAVQSAQIMRALYRLFIEKDCTLIEINPMVVTGSEGLLALDAKISIDDSALFRQPEMAALADTSQVDPLELRASYAGFSYVKMDGSIGCLVNGAGLAMATMDLVTLLGGRPANFLDVGGAADEKIVRQAITLLLDDSNVKVAWINIFGGILRCDIVARALLHVLGERHPGIPFVVRLRGTNDAEAREMLNSGPMTLMLEPDLGRAARLAVAATGTPGRRKGDAP